MISKPILRTVTMALGLVLLGATTASAGPLFSWSWNAGDAGDVDNNAGVINWVNASFDSNSRELTWTANFGAVPGLPGAETMGFALSLTSGGAPSEAGEASVLYYDASRTQPILTGYGYNGEAVATTWWDGSDAAGCQEPDLIASSNGKIASTWVHEFFDETEADGSKTLGFRIDAGVFLDHDPLYADASTAWRGPSLSNLFGVSMQTYAGLSTTYFEENINSMAIRRTGHLNVDAAHGAAANPVPEPTSLILLALGGSGLVGAKLRRRRNGGDNS